MTSIASASLPLARDRTAQQILTEARLAVEPAHRAAIDALPPPIRHLAGYHIGWWEADGRPASHYGKAVRPALVLACARAAASTAARPLAEQAALPSAVAVELIHDFSLLHDDVMDSDPVRRHRPAAWTVFGTGQAVLAGDALLTAAMQQLPTWPAARVLARAVQGLCRGQADDLAFESRHDVTVAEAMAMADGKTAALLAAACRLGAAAAGADDEIAGRFEAFGRHLGIAFQLVDDVLGIWGDPSVTGKPAGSDLSARKKSLPVVAALNSGTSAGRQLARLYRHQRALDEPAVALAAELVERAGGRTWAETEAAGELAMAFTALGPAAAGPKADTDLHLLAALITRRDH
jgi:geranylgeranyl diphosphate synthase, type I